MKYMNLYSAQAMCCGRNKQESSPQELVNFPSRDGERKGENKQEKLLSSFNFPLSNEDEVSGLGYTCTQLRATALAVLKLLMAGRPWQAWDSSR